MGCRWIVLSKVMLVPASEINRNPSLGHIQSCNAREIPKEDAILDTYCGRSFNKNIHRWEISKKLHSDRVGIHLRGLKDESEHRKTFIYGRNKIKYTATSNMI